MPKGHSLPTLDADARSVLVRRRESLGLSQRELARRVGISQPGINHIEVGRRQPSVELLERIAGALGLSVDVRVRLTPAQTAGRKAKARANSRTPRKREPRANGQSSAS